MFEIKGKIKKIINLLVCRGVVTLPECSLTFPGVRGAGGGGGGGEICSIVKILISIEMFKIYVFFVSTVEIFLGAL